MAVVDHPKVVTDAHVEADVESIVQAADVRDAYPCGTDLLLTMVERNPEDLLPVSLLAQIYFDLGDFSNACKWYARLIEIGGPGEAIFVAMWRIAQAMALLGEPWPNVQDAYLKAWAFRPTRAEPLYHLARRYRVEQQYRLGYLFAERAAQIPLPEEDSLFVFADVYAWRAVDEQAVCASWIGNDAEAFMLCRRLLARSDVPDQRRQGIAGNRDFSVPAMLKAASSYPEALVGSLVAGPRDAEVTVSLVAGPDRDTTEQTLNSFLHCCTDVSRVGRFVVLDAGLSAPDRTTLQERYGFLEFVDRGPGVGPGVRLAQLRAQIGGRFWLHLDQGWRFFAPENYITRLAAVLDAEPQVFQVGINFGDAVKLTKACAAEETVRRTPDAGRYLITDEVTRGPAMFDTARLDGAGGVEAADLNPIAALGRRAVAAALQAASLDEVLCITAVHQVQQPAQSTYYENLVDHVDRTVELIHGISDENVFNVDYLEHDLIPALGLNNEELWEQPEELAPYFGTGLHLWQYPNQLSKYLVWLARNASSIRSYLEIGCRWGGTFILVNEWLKRIGATLDVSVAVDPIPPTPFMARYMEISDTPVIYQERFSTDPSFISFLNELRPEMVFIDGDHTWKGVINDHFLVRKIAKIIVHHDISSDPCPPTTRFWQYASATEDEFIATAFTDQYPTVNGKHLGIGVMIRK